MTADPNQIASCILRRRIKADGTEEWRVETRVSSAIVSPLKAVMALKSGIIRAVDQVLSGDLPAPGNGDVEGVTFHVKAGDGR